MSKEKSTVIYYEVIFHPTKRNVIFSPFSRNVTFLTATPRSRPQNKQTHEKETKRTCLLYAPLKDARTAIARTTARSLRPYTDCDTVPHATVQYISLYCTVCRGNIGLRLTVFYSKSQ